jgi:cytoskeletal protein RodZ
MSESIGKIFKDARRQKELSIGEVSKRTNISHSMISSIEDDNFEALSPVYMKSFVKLYANFLGLDTEKILKLYHEFAQLPEEEYIKRKVPQQTQMVAEENLVKGFAHIAQKRKKTIIIVVGIIILFLALKAIYKAWSVRRIQARSAVAELERTKPSNVKSNQEEKDNPLAGLNLNDNLRLSVHAKSDCWLKVRVDDKLIFQGTLKKAEVENWQAQERIDLKLGNPAAVDLELNGKVLDQFGTRSSKSRSVLITKQGIKLGK